MTFQYPSTDIILKDIQWIQAVFSAKDPEYFIQRHAAEEYRLDLSKNRVREFESTAEYSHRHPDIPCPHCAQEFTARHQREIRNPESLYIPYPSYLGKVFDSPAKYKTDMYTRLVQNYYHKDTSLYPNSEKRYTDFMNTFENNPFFKMNYLEQYDVTQQETDPNDFFSSKLVGFTMFTCGMCDTDGYILPSKLFYHRLKEYQDYEVTSLVSRHVKNEMYENLCVLYTFFIISHAFYYAFKNNLSTSHIAMKSLFRQTSAPMSLE